MIKEILIRPLLIITFFIIGQIHKLDFISVMSGAVFALIEMKINGGSK